MKRTDNYVLTIDLTRQHMAVEKNLTLFKNYTISSATNGAGEKNGSFCTPRGRHIIRAKIGEGMPDNTIFVERRPMGRWTEALGTNGDWILTRILWLSGCEMGFNRLGDVDTMRRFIYIHGTPDSTPMGQPSSRGCIRMRNHDIIELFSAVPVGTAVNIFA